ncbi:hypothetical protein BaRGS_00001458, partial [Batillaria attramentaria]
VDKCMEEPDYCNHTCSDSEFGERTCSCMDGFTLDADGRTCNDINECATDNGGCEHNCANSDGSYECSCRQGYSLFVSDGTEGFFLAPNEDGMRPGDVRRFNHSCVQDVPNGERLSNKSSYHYNDEIRYFCNLGYELSGNNPLTCDSTGQWNFATPQCQIATCPPDTLPPGLLNPAVVSPVAPVNLSEHVTLTCNVPGVGTFTRTRTCVYQDGQYKLMGADYECGLVDCGAPEQQPNSVYLDDSTTTYGSNFTFSCRNQTAPSGGSEESGDTVVRCRSDGLWDFGTLQCEGLTCTDPGRPAGGTQVATFDSYRPGGQVSFQCTQQGFALSNTNPLQCQLNAAGNGVAWNTQDLPECVDTENPVLTGCASEKVLVDRYSPASQSVTVPTFTDNFAVKRFRVTASGTDQVLWPSANYLLSAEVSMFTFTATDFNDNENTCTVVTERRDDYTTWREFKTDGQTIGVTFTASDVIVSDDKGTQAPTFNSANGGFGSTFVVTEGNLSKSFPPFASGDYVATVSDTSGNTASCTFEVTFKPESCSPFTLRKPVHGQRDCQETSTGFNCSLTCDTGYVFYDAPDDSSIVRTCVTGEDWPEPQITACVKADGADQDAQFHQVFRFNYTMADDGTQTGCSDLDNYKDLIDRKLPNVVALIPETCNTDDNADRPQGQIEVSSITSDGQVTVEYTLTYEEREPRIYTQCKGIVAENFIGDFKLNRELRGPFTPNFCPQLEEIAARSTDQGLYYGEIVNPGEYVCQTGKKIMYEGNEVCVTCPEGMQSVGDVCQPCPVGTYNEVAGSTLCTRCTAGSSTFSTGSTSQQECTAVCRPGRFSATGLPPCQMCPKNTYSVNSTHCEPCPTNYITRNTGADNQTYCLGFYADQEGAETCTACSANEETAGEGSTSSQNCTEITACRPGNDPCQNGGTCNLANRDVVCSCPDGYYGQFCQLPIDLCNNNPCYNGGTCQQHGNKYNCSCPTGASGPRCETIAVSCSDSTCENGAVCRNDLNDFTCLCPPGFSGKSCNVTTPICDSNQCENGATCVPLGNVRYRCNCPAGYSGKFCEENIGLMCESNIDDCQNHTCRAPGTYNCTDMVNGYKCMCKPGYTGQFCQLCENIRQNCLASTCTNSAQCYNLFGDFYCSCLPNTFGKTCSNAPSVCVNANPCLNNSRCTESAGTPMCECTNMYTGEGCQILRDFCSTTDPVCQNGGKCKKEGNVDREFDLLFTHPDKNNMAALAYPLHLSGDGFSITMWVQYMKKFDTGTFFTLYKVPNPNSLAGKEEIIRLDESGLTIALDGNPTMLNTTVEFNQGEWHFIVLSWNRTTGRFSFFVDTIRIPIDNYNQGAELDMYVWMVLGCRYDTATDMCTKGAGFTGHISQVTLYNRELVFREELTLVGNVNPTYVFRDAVMTWGEFLLYPGVTRSYPSKADKSCPKGFQGFPGCTTPVPEGACPQDIITYSDKRVTEVNWTFNGGANRVKSSLPSDSVYLWGKHPVVIEAENQDGNKALCSFDIYVRYSDCPKPSTPLNAEQVYCAPFFRDEGNRQYRQCSLNCQDNHKPVVAIPDTHTCGPVGSWAPPSMYLPYKLPSLTSTPRRRVVVVIVYHVASTECDKVREDLQEQIVLKLQQQNSLWALSLCKQTSCSDVIIAISCTLGGSAGRRKRQASTPTDVEVTITFDDAPTLLTKTADASVLRTPEDLMRSLVLSGTDFDFSERIADSTPDPNGLEVRLELWCQSPRALIGEVCVECAEGSFYNATTQQCQLCPIGQYQDQAGQTECKGCSSDKTTETEGSTTSNDCKSVCPVGQFYNGDSCADCSVGFFQDEPGFFYCLPCSVDKITRQTGATSESLCFDACPPGEELTPDGSCKDCDIGSYKATSENLCEPCEDGLATNFTGADSKDDCNVERNGTQDSCKPCDVGFYRTGVNPYSSCTPCPGNKRTVSTGATSADQCTIYKCPAGQKPTSDQSDCEDCPRGYYQPLADQTGCNKCPGTKEDTRTTGATSLGDCEEYCDSGYEKHSNGSCVVCSIGYYKDNTIDNFHNCTRCSNDQYVTPSEGATSDSDCTVLDCRPGTYIKGDVCETCPQGTYQDKSHWKSCETCPTNTSTRLTGSTDANDCEAYCEAGYEKKTRASNCEVCPRGYYKNNVDDVFMDCTLCPPDYVTPDLGAGVGATDISQCNVRNCTPGQYISGNNCSACEIGYYQPDWWQDSCIACVTDRTTMTTGATNQSQCILSCPPGKENKAGADVCTVCERGFYKDVQAAAPCSPCAVGFTTRITGATAESACDLRACEPGFKPRSSGCVECGLGTYQPDKWEEDCINCTSGRTTYQTGANSSELCLPDCPSGSKLEGKECVKCPRGQYRNRAEGLPCRDCPTDLTTPADGAVSQDDSTCAVGLFFNSTSRRCETCPKNQYQNQTGQSECKPCPATTSTEGVGKTSPNDCKDICDEEGYCINANGCNRITLRCVCRDNYVGDRCDTRTAAQAGLGEKDTMIIAIVVPLILLLIIIVIVIGCILWMRQRHKSKEFIERASERGSIAARMSPRGGYDGTYEAFEAKSAPLVGGQRMMLPEYSNEMYENPVYMPREGDWKYFVNIGFL